MLLNRKFRDQIGKNLKILKKNDKKLLTGETYPSILVIVTK